VAAQSGTGAAHRNSRYIHQRAPHRDFARNTSCGGCAAACRSAWSWGSVIVRVGLSKWGQFTEDVLSTARGSSPLLCQQVFWGCVAE
jgi:hypothetical protein